MFEQQSPRHLLKYVCSNRSSGVMTKKMCSARKLVVSLFIVTCLGAVIAEIRTTLEPISYTLNITVLYKPSNDRAYEGNVTITGIALVQSDEIHLHSSGLNIESVTVRGDPFSVDSRGYTTYPNNETLVIRTSMYRVGDPITINIRFTGNISDSLIGFYRSVHIPYQSWVDTTQLQSVNARKAFPCFDLPKFRSHFVLNFVVNTTMDVISNMPVQSTVTGQMSGTKRVSFQRTPRMPTYLLAWIIYHPSNFGNLYTGSNVSIWGRLSLRNQTYPSVIAQYATTILGTLEQFTGIPYAQMMPKMDLAAIPDFSGGAVENWGLVNFRESRLMCIKTATSQDIESLKKIISHELSHQWFGNLVTPYSWSYIWLNEGFATYFEYMNYGWDDLLVVNEIQPIMQKDSPATHPLTKEGVETREDVDDMFDKISYSKGAAILRMVRQLMGADNFKKGIRTYLRTAAIGSIVPNSIDPNVKFINITYPDLLWRALNESTPSEVLPSGVNHLGAVMKSWTDTPSYPLVRFVKNGTSYQISQELQTNDASNRTSSVWWIPVTFLNEQFIWLPPNASVKFKTSNDWYYVNVNSTGYYRVIYDDENWSNLTKVLKMKPCPLTELARSQILTDALALMTTGHVTPSVAFNLIEFLRDETSDVVLKSAFNSLMAVSEDLIDSANWETWKEYVRDLTTNVSKSRVYEMVEENNTIATIIIQNACFYGNSTCIQRANDLKTNYRGFSPNLRSALLCTAMKNVTLTEWRSMYALYESTESPPEKQNILQNLCCAEDPRILNELLNYLIYSSSIQSSNLKTVIQWICSTAVGAKTTFAFLKDNYSMIRRRLQFDGEKEAEFMDSIVQKLTTKEEIAEVENFLNNTSTMGIRSEKRFAMLAQARLNIQRRMRTEKFICTVLRCTASGAGAAKTSVGWSSRVILALVSIVFLYN